VDILDTLLRAPPRVENVESLAAWFEHLARCPYERPLDRALWAGFEADRLGYAFVGGYRAALQELFVVAATKLGQPLDRFPTEATRLSLAATEVGGAHPRSIATTLTGGFLSGEKSFATLASAADELLVVAALPTNENEVRPTLRLVRVRAGAPGVKIEDRAATLFAPEIPHARVKLANVVITENDVLPGDGYDVYLKPFRTLEDAHVLAATLGNVIAAARAYAFDRTIAERASALALAVRANVERGPTDPTAHVVLAGLFEATRRLIAESESDWKKAPAGVSERWARDLPLLLVAETVRQKRTEAAWSALG
jgi:alkylation response protein AidB-like acyl-CoA dehydrogenase